MQGSTVGAALWNTSFGQDKSGIRWTYRHSIVHGFRSPVQGVLPILPSHAPRIGIFCLTRRCRPLLLPAGSIRSSSPSGWHEDCFKPKALQVPGSPLRPYRSTSGFSGPCRCPCWGKTGKNCISQGHSWSLAYLLKDLCRGYCNVNFGIVKFAALTVWRHWMRCQSFRTTFDQMTGSHSNSPGKYDRDYGFPKDSWYSIGGSWWRKDWESIERHPAKVCHKCCYRLASLWFWWAATQAWLRFETSWKYFTFTFALGAGQIDPESTAGHAICDNSLNHHQNC